MGVVYAAYDPELDRRVAIKLLGTTLSAGAEARLVREAQAMARVVHANVVSVIEVGRDRGQAFVVMEYFPEGSLRDQMTLAGPAEEDQVWRLLGDLLSALDVAHRASLLHLDIKPANVLLDGRGGFVLTDFGVTPRR